MKYVKKRGNRYHYIRRVPKDLKEVDEREFIQLSLKTDSFTIAQQRAAILDKHVTEYWQNLITAPDDDYEKFDHMVKFARLQGFSYSTPSKIAAKPIEEVVSRVISAQRSANSTQKAALLGNGNGSPELTLSEVLEKYWSLSRDKALGKSSNQMRKWRNPRKKALKNFIDVIGDKPLNHLERFDVLNFKDWWIERLEEENLKPNSANKDFNHLRVMLQTVNDDLRLDLPIISLFERINIRDDVRSSRLSFEPDFVRHTLLNRNKLSTLNEDLWLFICAMADTGARINELTGLDVNAGDISLEGNIPYVNIRPNHIGKLKTPDSERVIPLVGSALFAFRQRPEGFIKYIAKPDSLSSALNKWFRDNEILPSSGHSLYSLRHCFQDRLIEIEAPERVQAELMGHKFHRPKYGAGSNLEQKHRWLSKMAFGITDNLT